MAASLKMKHIIPEKERLDIFKDWDSLSFAFCQ